MLHWRLREVTGIARMFVRQAFNETSQKEYEPDKFYWVEGHEEARFSEQEALELLQFFKDVVYYKPKREIQRPSIIERINEFSTNEKGETNLKIVMRILSSYLSEKVNYGMNWEYAFEVSTYDEDVLDIFSELLK